MPDELLPYQDKPQSNPVTIKQIPREVLMFAVGEHELDGLTSTNAPLFLSFFGISMGALISLGTTLWTVPIPQPVSHATFVGMAWVSLAGTVVFAILSISSIRATKQK